MAEIGATAPLAARIVRSYSDAVADLRNWSALSADMARATARA
jgi:hypothetical protein